MSCQWKICDTDAHLSAEYRTRPLSRHDLSAGWAYLHNFERLRQWTCFNVRPSRHEVTDASFPNQSSRIADPAPDLHQYVTIRPLTTCELKGHSCLHITSSAGISWLSQAYRCRVERGGSLFLQGTGRTAHRGRLTGLTYQQ
jgi:hypothetical protein